MRSNFGLYSQYYDLLYSDKDYLGEVSYILKFIKGYGGPNFESILELGCGTGIHATLMSSRGYDVCGIDMSPDMLEKACYRASRPEHGAKRISFLSGDVRSFRSSRSFDVVVSLFHVASYQITDRDLLAMFETAFIHLKPNGLFIFDFWYGPAVLSQKPVTRIKKLKNEHLQISRIAQPTLLDNENIVEVNYDVYVKNLADGEIQVVNETHKMRYLFLPEIKHFLNLTGFDMVNVEEWLTSQHPSIETWGVCVVAKKVNAY